MTEIEQLNAQGYIDRVLPDGQRLTLQPLLFGMAQLGISAKPPALVTGVFVDSWDFPDVFAGLQAYLTWNPEETPEPTGWHRHFSSGRYRIDGDANLEYVKFPGSAKSIEEEVRHAIQAMQSKDRVITEIWEDPDQSPAGYVFFVATSESSECDHEPRCQWHDRIFYWRGRCVVVALHECHVDTQSGLPPVSMANVKQRLTGENAKDVAIDAIPRNE